jgi:hypothetical protein
MHRFSPLFLLVMFIPLIEGCSDDPNAIGSALIPKGDAITLAADTINASASATDTAHIQGTSTTLLLGKFGHLEARTLLEFDGIPADKPLATIDSAILTLHIDYRFKDSAGGFGFSIDTLLLAWNSTSLTWANLVPDSLYRHAADTTFAVQAEDTVLTVHIEPIVRSWFQAENSAPYGFILIPSPVQTFVLGFANYVNGLGDFRPMLTIGYHDSTAGDTTTLTLAPSQVLFLANSERPVPTDTVYVQAGIAYRGHVKFDLGSLPKNVSITSATMNLFLNSSSSLRNAYTVNSIIANPALDSSSLPGLSSLSAVGAPDLLDSSMFDFDIKSFVQQWIATSPNYGMMLRATNEYISLDGFVFYGAKADAAHRPRLTIKYTQFPQKARRAKP